MEQLSLKMPGKFSDLPVFSVAELRDRLSKLVKGHFTSSIVVKGIISSIPKLYPSFVFFDIRDDKKNMSFTVSGYIGIFHSIEKKLKATGVVESLTVDVPVMLVVDPTISTQKNISIRLSIVDIIPEYTTSVIAAAKDITLNKLDKEGLLNLQKELELPMLIRNIGLITSDQGTSAQDIMSGVGSVARFINIIFQPVRVEGNIAVVSIVDALNKFNRYRKKLEIDAVIIARGGGSSVDLAPFNDYTLCRTVCLSKIPIITAIGHDKDEHAIELCSHITPIPSTPSGIGAFIKQKLFDVREDLEITTEAISSSVADRFLREELSIKERLNLIFSSLKRIFTINFMRLSTFVDTIVRENRRLFDYSSERVSELNKLLNAYNHYSVLKRGYSMVWDSSGYVVKRKKDMPDIAELEFYDGRLKIRKEGE